MSWKLAPGRAAQAAADAPVELARRCGIERVLLFHHDPSRTDSEVAELEQAFGGSDGSSSRLLGRMAAQETSDGSPLA